MSKKDKLLAMKADENDSELNVKWKRHEFSDYLSKNGVTAAITKIMLELTRTEERPVDPIEFIRNRMRPDNGDVREIEEYRRKIDELKTKTDTVRAEKDQLLALKQKIWLIYDEKCNDDKL